MSIKLKISLGVSVALTLFFAWPWISIFQEVKILQQYVSLDTAKTRFTYMALSVFVTSLFLFQYNFYWKNKIIKQKKPGIAWSLDLLTNILLILLFTVLFLAIMSRLFQIEPIRAYFTLYLFRNVATGFVVMIVVYIYNLIEKSKLDKIRILTLANEKSETELAVLKSQIDPHFLFNALNSLTGLIREDAREAIQFVNHLSETFRYTLEHRQQKMVTLQEELNFLKSYMFMMKARFGDGLRMETEIKETHRDKKLPQFALQLLVENAIKHNTISQSKPLTVSILSDDAKLLVSNNLQPRRQSVQGYGIGLANLAQRYQLLEGRDIEVQKTKDKFQVNRPLL